MDAGYYNSNINLKFKYADSAILSAKFSNDNQRVVTAYIGERYSLLIFIIKNIRSHWMNIKVFDYAKDWWWVLAIYYNVSHGSG